jgi:hypothetical protein
MKVDTYACDVCQTIKKDTNHWWLMWIDGHDDASFCGLPAMHAAPWNLRGLATAEFHLCGEACVQKKVAEFLSIKPKTTEESNGNKQHPDTRCAAR